MTGRLHTSRTLTILDWHPCRRGDDGAVWTGARWTCPPFGACAVLIAAAGVAVRVARAERPTWRPWWERHTDPGPVTLFSGDQTGVKVGAL
jgi:hypothetical protein